MNDYEKMVADYLKRGGAITKCPTAFSGVVKGAQLSDEHRSALSAYHESRKPTYKLRQALRNGQENYTSPPELPLERTRFVKMGEISQANAKERTEKKTAEAKPKMNQLSGIGTTRNKMSYLEAGQEVYSYRLKNGSTEVHSVDHAGRRHIASFSPNGRYLGSKQVFNG